MGGIPWKWSRVHMNYGKQDWSAQCLVLLAHCHNLLSLIFFLESNIQIQYFLSKVLVYDIDRSSITHLVSRNLDILDILWLEGSHFHLLLTIHHPMLSPSSPILRSYWYSNQGGGGTEMPNIWWVGGCPVRPRKKIIVTLLKLGLFLGRKHVCQFDCSSECFIVVQVKFFWWHSPFPPKSSAKSLRYYDKKTSL